MNKLEIKTFNYQETDMAMATHVGDRSINQDCADIFFHNGVIVLALADGMGGHPRGEVASSIFVDCARLLLRKHTREHFSAEHYMQDVMQTADHKIKAFGNHQDPVIAPRTTAVLVSIHHGEMQWSHLGDSRTYLFRHNRAHLRTLDHTPVEILRLQGELEDADSQSNAVGRSGVLRCLGSSRQPDDIQVTPPRPLQSGDLLLLCTDGVWSQLPQQQLEGMMLAENLTLPERTGELINAAVTAGQPRSDNATALALHWNNADNENQASSIDSDDLETAIAQLRRLIKKYP